MSHNSMTSFFSDTDTQELQDNAPNHNYYLSLIVNNDLQMTAKLAFIGEQETKEDIVRSFFGDNGRVYNIKTKSTKKEKVLFVYNCNIDFKYEIPVPEDFEQRTSKIIQDYQDKLKKSTAGVNWRNNLPVQRVIPFERHPYDAYSEDFDTEFFDMGNTKNREVSNNILEKLLVDSIMGEYDCGKTIDEALFNGLQEYKKDPEGYITQFGIFITNMAPMYDESLDLNVQEEVVTTLQEMLLDYQDVGFEEYIEDLITELEIG